MFNDTSNERSHVIITVDELILTFDSIRFLATSFDFGDVVQQGFPFRGDGGGDIGSW